MTTCPWNPAAADAASSGVAAQISQVTGTPNFANSALLSYSLRGPGRNMHRMSAPTATGMAGSPACGEVFWRRRHIAENAAAQASGAAKVGMPARLRCLTACGALGLANTTTGLSVRAKQSRNGAPTVSGSMIEDEPKM